MEKNVKEEVVKNEAVEEVKEEKKGFLSKIKNLKKTTDDTEVTEEKPKKDHKGLKRLALAAGVAVVGGGLYLLGKNSAKDSDDDCDDLPTDSENEFEELSNEENV